MWQKKNIRLETPDDLLDTENFLDRVFGLHRHSRTVNLMRKNIAPNYRYSLHYDDDNGSLFGMIRIYDVMLDDGTSASLLGPVAVRPEYQSKGLGSFLMKESLLMIDDTTPNNHIIFLSGKPDYYQRFGFLAVHRSGVRYDSLYYFDGPITPLVLMARCRDGDEPLHHGGRLNFANRL